MIKALCLTKYGKNLHENLRFLECDLPPIGPTDLVIEVFAAAINPIDYKTAEGGITKLVIKKPLPFALGFDVAGKVIQTGNRVTDFETGAEVYAKAPWKQMGTLATYIVIDQNSAAVKPKSLKFSEAAGLPLVGCTVIDSFRVGELKKGMKILILGGSGGIGTFAIQYAKHLGAEVYTTTSTKNVEWVKKLGADHVIDYTKEDYTKLAKNVDFVYDTLGGKHTYKALKLIKKGGTIISIAGHYDSETLKSISVPKPIIFLNQIGMSWLNLRLYLKKIRYKHVWSTPNHNKLNEISHLVKIGAIKPVIDREFPFEKAVDGLIYQRTNRAKGKVIIRMKSELILGE